MSTMSRTASLMYSSPVCKIFINYHDPNTVAREEAEAAAAEVARRSQSVDQDEEEEEEFVFRPRSYGRRSRSAGHRRARRFTTSREGSLATSTHSSSYSSLPSTEPIVEEEDPIEGTSFNRVMSTEDDSEEESLNPRYTVYIVDPLADEDVVEEVTEDLAALGLVPEDGLENEKKQSVEVKFASPVHLEYRDLGTLAGVAGGASKSGANVIQEARFVSVADINAAVLSSFLKKPRPAPEKERRRGIKLSLSRKKKLNASTNSLGSTASSQRSWSSLSSFASSRSSKVHFS